MGVSVRIFPERIKEGRKIDPEVGGTIPQATSGPR